LVADVHCQLKRQEPHDLRRFYAADVVQHIRDIRLAQRQQRFRQLSRCRFKLASSVFNNLSEGSHVVPFLLCDKVAALKSRTESRAPLDL
jgi:hypothetical protein